MKFDRLTVVEAIFETGKRKRWLCRCECGGSSKSTATNLRSGSTRSCGCLHREVASRMSQVTATHGRSRTPEHRAWMSIKQRCFRESDKSYPSYGGRGITMCDRWAHSFSAFLDEVGQRPSPEHSIDRIDNDGNYEPGNVRWATRSEQQRNRRCTVLTADGVDDIHARRARGESYGVIAKALGVSNSSVRDAALGITWKDATTT